MRSVGFGPRGSRAAVELTLGAAAMPAVVVEGNLEVKGNPTVTGPAGSIHANGTLELSGNPCTHVYYASVAGTTESGNVQGGTGCTAADVDSRPFSPRINIPQARSVHGGTAGPGRGRGREDADRQERRRAGWHHALHGQRGLRLHGACRQGRPAAASRRRWRRSATIPTGLGLPDQRQDLAHAGADRGRHVLHRRQCGHHGEHRRRRRPATSAACRCWRWARSPPTAIRRSSRTRRSRSSGPILMIAGLRPRPRRRLRRRLRGPVLRAAPAGHQGQPDAQRTGDRPQRGRHRLREPRTR